MGCMASENVDSPKRPSSTVVLKTHEGAANTKENTQSPGKIVKFAKLDPKSIASHYKFDEILSQDKFGTTYKGIHILTGETRTIKAIRKSTALPIDDEEALAAEISTLKELNHTNIIKVVEFFMDKQNYYLVSEWIEDVKLLDAVKSQQITEEVVAEIIAQVLSAVVYCHSRKIIHRNLTPDSILVEKQSLPKYRVKVVDFGVADIFYPAPTAKELIDSAPNYAAPEAFDKHYGEKSDIWSVGVMMYLLLSGYAPFTGENAEELSAAIKKGKYTDHGKVWETISKDAKDLLERMLVVSPYKRASAMNAHTHKWIHLRNPFSEPAKQPSSSSSLYTFAATHNMRNAVEEYVLSQIVAEKEGQVLTDLFKRYEKNQTGELYMDELIQAYTELYGDETMAREMSKDVFNKLGVDSDGYVDYEKIIKETVNSRIKSALEELSTAFSCLEPSKIRPAFVGLKGVSPAVWQNAVEFISQNAEITFDQLKKSLTINGQK